MILSHPFFFFFFFLLLLLLFFDHRLVCRIKVKPIYIYSVTISSLLLFGGTNCNLNLVGGGGGGGGRPPKALEHSLIHSANPFLPRVERDGLWKREGHRSDQGRERERYSGGGEVVDQIGVHACCRHSDVVVGHLGKMA